MTRKALDIALYASCFADFVSNLSLILLAGLLAGFALFSEPSALGEGDDLSVPDHDMVQ